MKDIIERLKKKGVVLTPQRLAVIKALESATSHPTADKIYDKIKKRYPTISLSTVYSILEVLKNAGEIQELTIRRGKSYFDPNPEPHHHFFCQQCNRVFDIMSSYPVSLKGEINKHRIEKVQVYFYGVCSECLNKAKNHRS